MAEAPLEELPPSVVMEDVPVPPAASEPVLDREALVSIRKLDGDITKLTTVPLHVGDLPPEDQKYDQFYVPHTNAALAESAKRHEPTGKSKERLQVILDLLERPPSSIKVQYVPNLTLAEINKEQFEKIHLLDEDDPWNLFRELADLTTGDVLACASYDNVFYYTPRPDLNIFKSQPLVRKQCAELMVEREMKFLQDLSSKSADTKIAIRLTRLEENMKKCLHVLEGTVKLQEAVQSSLRMHTVKNFNADLMQHLRLNVAHLAQDNLRMKKYMGELQEKIEVNKLKAEARIHTLTLNLKHLEQLAEDEKHKYDAWVAGIEHGPATFSFGNVVAAQYPDSKKDT